MDTLRYKQNSDEVMQRLRSLWERRAPDRIFALFQVPSATLEKFKKDNPEGYCEYPDPATRIAFWDNLLRERIPLEDDSIPSAYLSELDQGLYGGLLGGDVQFMSHPENGWISSMVPPILNDWTELDSLQIDLSHPWYRTYLQQLETFVEGSKSRFGISHFILINHLNLAFELVGGTATYMSMIENPAMLRKAIALAFDLNVLVQTCFFEKVPLINGGTCSNMVQWIPGRIVSESVDPFHMTSMDDFEKWGHEPLKQMFEQFDGGVLHIHGNGRHLLRAVSKLRGLKAIYLGDDRGFPLAFDILDEIRDQVGDVPLVVTVNYPDFEEYLSQEKLCGGVLYQVNGAPDVKTANKCMKKVRAYRCNR